MAKRASTSPPYDQVSARRLMADTAALAQWVRLSGTPEELEAFKYTQRQLRAAGCRTTLILHDAFISLPGPASLAVARAGEPTGSVPCVTHSFAASTGPDGIEAPMVYAGGGTPVEFATASPQGKIAVVDGLANPARVQAGQAAGAVGLVFLNRDPLVHEMIVSTVWGSPTLEQLARLPRIPVVSVARADGDRLREIAQTGGARLRITAQADTGWRQTPILTGDLPGEVDDTFVLFAGHIDSWHRGAMDNGTANATMLEIARVMARQKRYRGIRFAFWSGHSHGRYSGSTWYADHYWNELNARCVAHVNVDSTGGVGSVINRHAYAMPETRGLADRVIRTVADERFEGGRVGRMGDQSFLGVGVPSLFMDVSEQPGDSPHASRDFSVFSGGATGGLGWWWHTTDDLPDKIDPAALERDAKIYLGIIHALSTEPVLPLDYHATAVVWHKRLQALRKGAGRWVDLRPAVAEAARLVEATARMARRAEALRKAPRAGAVRAHNAGVMALGRALIPVDYTMAGRFGHDPALEQRDVPLLASVRALAGASPDHARHLAVQAVRDLNAVRFALAQGAAVTTGAANQARRRITAASSDPARRAARRPAG